jgi:ubiquinol oxidase
LLTPSERQSDTSPGVLARKVIVDTNISTITSGLTERPPFGPMQRLTPTELQREHQATLRSPRRRYRLSSQALFRVMDTVYGKGRSLEKFRVLELVARVPYQAWEQVAYVAMTHTAKRPTFARRVFNTVRTSRWEQDNEQWHLLILEEMLADKVVPARSLGVLRRSVIPQLLAAVYFQLSWVLFVGRPKLAYQLNADFEDHAEHEYALLLNEHPEWETLRWNSTFADDFGHYESVAELFRQISYDERLHKEHSESMLDKPRF